MMQFKTFGKRSCLNFCGILLIIPLLSACMSIEEDENLYHGILYSDDAELYYGIVFPDFNDHVIENEVTNPVFPDTKITHWSIQGMEEGNYYHYFLSVQELSDSIKSSIASFEGGLVYLMKSGLFSGVSNNGGENPRIIEFKHDYLTGLEVTADFEDFLQQEGKITIQSFSDGDFIVSAGVVSSDPNDRDANAFLESFVVERE